MVTFEQYLAESTGDSKVTSKVVTLLRGYKNGTINIASATKGIKDTLGITSDSKIDGYMKDHKADINTMDNDALIKTAKEIVKHYS